MDTCETVLAIDPGNSTGWVYRRKDGVIVGGTLPESLCEVAKLIRHFSAHFVVFESFQLYPSKAQKLMWNTFYPCEVIGVIKYITGELAQPLVSVQPSAKKFSGVQSGEWKIIQPAEQFLGKGITEHTRDAYQLLRFFERNKKDLCK